MNVQLNVVTLTKRLANMIVPFVGQLPQFGISGLVLSEGKLLHRLGVERAKNPIRVIDLYELPHRSKLKLANVPRAITAQLPIINESKIDCWFHFSTGICSRPRNSLPSANGRRHLHGRKLGQ